MSTTTCTTMSSFTNTCRITATSAISQNYSFLVLLLMPLTFCATTPSVLLNISSFFPSLINTQVFSSKSLFSLLDFQTSMFVVHHLWKVNNAPMFMFTSRLIRHERLYSLCHLSNIFSVGSKRLRLLRRRFRFLSA